MGTPGQDDVRLVRQAQQGDRAAFSELFARYHAPVLNYVYHQLGDRAAAEDVAQDAFVRAHQRLGQLGPPWDFKSWVYRIASNLTVDHVRGQRRFVDLEEPPDLIEPPTTRRPMERRLQQEETRQAVRRTLDALPTVYRQALILRELQALSYEETARALECSYDNARQLVHRARLRFRALHGMPPVEAAAPRCQELGDLLTAEIDDALAPDERRAVRAHLEVCAECRETRRDLRALAGMLAVLPALPPDPAWAAQVLERLGGGGGGGGGAGGAQAAAAPAAPGTTGGGLLAGLGGGGGALMPLALAGAIGLGALMLLAAWGLGSGGPHMPALPPGLTPTATALASPAAASPMPPAPAASPLPATHTAAPAASLTPTLGPPVAHAQSNANCRAGPGEVYDVVGGFHTGQSAPIDGRDEGSAWWWIESPAAPVRCWVWAGAVSTSGDLSGVPVLAAPPTPTPADTQPPTVAISHTPSGSNRPHQFEQVTFSAQAADDRAVARIEIWLRPPGASAFTLLAACNDSLTCQVTAGPYAPGSGAYRARAWDPAGNLVETSPIPFTVHPSLY